MKRIIYNLFLCLMFLPFVSCESEDLGQHLKDTDVITLNLYTSSPVSRAPMQDELHEYALSHLDVFIFSDETDDNQKSKVHYERILTNVSPDGEVTLTGKKRNDFGQNDYYWVYVLANSTVATDDLGVIANLAELKGMTQEDPLLHLTATSASNAPKNFLMDGIAFSGDTEPVTPETVVLNDGTAAKTTELNVNLNRAAAKVVVELSKGDNVTFHQNEEEGYYLRNLPTVTTLLAGTTLSAGTQELVTTTKSVTAYSTFTANKVTVTAYVYAHSWQQERFFTDGTSLVLNIPLTYDGDGDLTTTNDQTRHPNSYYQIELRHNNERSFDRNHYYLITGTINAPGATEDTQPVDLDKLKYQALDWTEKPINVGGEEKPTYLKVNKDTLRIYNQAIDESLVFASSSPVTISVHGEVVENNSSLEGSDNPYFYNKFGVKTPLSGSNGNFTEMVSGDNQTSPVTISAVPDTGLSGNIKVESTIPANNAVRYFALLITNEDGLKEKVLVEQYPVIYITNILGWYSYRSDFKSATGNVTTYESGNTPYYNCARWNNGWSYESKKRDGEWNQPFFFSKVNTRTLTSGNNQGKSDLYYYHYTVNGIRDDNNFVIYKNAEDNNDERGGNARMYHVHVTATSGNYTVGRPRLDANGYPVNATDNARLVSPSFYIASQLGATQNPSSYTQAVTHCANYVETYKKVVYDSNGNPVLDPNGNNTGETVHLDDWRLPTAAEVEIILQYQYGQTGTTPTVAMDEVLAGENYYCVNPTNDNKVKNTRQDPNGNSTNTYVRCVRDAY